MTRRRIVLALLLAATAAATAEAQSRGRSPSRDGGKPATSPVTVNPSPGGSDPSRPCPPRPCPPPCFPILIGGSPWLGYPFAPITVAPQFTGLPVMPWEQAAQPAPPVLAIPTPAPRPAAAPRARGHNEARSKELTELGDRLFRAGNYVRAVERYEQAIRADEDRAAPRARLAQVALVRGKYADAANKLREAQAAEPGWLATAGDVQALYPEPAEYAKHVAKLEAHLQAHPEDRDAWLVLGALWYLSGRTQSAADVFLRLADRREDPTLRAFLQATKADGEGR